MTPTFKARTNKFNVQIGEKLSVRQATALWRVDNACHQVLKAYAYNPLPWSISDPQFFFIFKYNGRNITSCVITEGLVQKCNSEKFTACPFLVSARLWFGMHTYPHFRYHLDVIFVLMVWVTRHIAVWTIGDESWRGMSQSIPHAFSLSCDLRISRWRVRQKCINDFSKVCSSNIWVQALLLSRNPGIDVVVSSRG